MKLDVFGPVILFALLLVWPGAFAAEAPPDRPIHHQRGSWDPLRQPTPIPDDLRLSEARAAASRYHIAQLDGVLTPTQRQALQDAGVELLGFIPESAFVIRLEPGRLQVIRNLPFVRWIGPYHPGHRLSPDIGRLTVTDPARLADGRLWVRIEVFRGEEPQAVAHELEQLGLQVLGVSFFGDFRTIRAAAPSIAALRKAAELEAVQWIEDEGERTVRNNEATWVAQTNVSNLRSFWDLGLRGEGHIVGVIDDPLAMGSCYVRDDANNTPRPDHRKIVYYGGNMANSAHGTHVSASVAGLNVSGDLNNRGHAYMAKVAFSRLDLVSTDNLYEMFEAHHTNGARIHTNSWGNDSTTAYTADCAQIDGFSRDFEDDLVIFAATNEATLKTPENARNALAVGASLKAPNQHNFCSGGSGPTVDGRRKPEIYLPGCDTISSSTGSCGTSSLSGTSMAAPAVAGSAVLLRQYLLEGRHGDGTLGSAESHLPSGALTKAMLLNGAVDMTGMAGYPGSREGWGRLNLDQVLPLPGDPRRLYFEDIRHAAGLGAGQVGSHLLQVTDPSMDLRVTLVWTDHPSAAGSASPIVNRLHLELEAPGGSAYKGNVFSGGVSVTGGAFDDLNNVQQVHLPTPEVGAYQVRVHGYEINQGPQGYALVVTGGVEAFETISCTSIDVSPGPDGCEGEGQTFTANWSQASGAVTVEWDFDWDETPANFAADATGNPVFQLLPSGSRLVGARLIDDDETPSFCSVVVTQQPAAPKVDFLAHGAPLEICGDGDALIEPTEVWEVPVTLRNLDGCGTAGSVVASLGVNVGSLAGAVVSNGPQDFGTLGPLAEATRNFSFTVNDDGCPNPLILDVTEIDWLEGGPEERISAFTLDVGQAAGLAIADQEISPLTAAGGSSLSDLTPAFPAVEAASASLTFDLVHEVGSSGTIAGSYALVPAVISAGTTTNFTISIGANEPITGVVAAVTLTPPTRNTNLQVLLIHPDTTAHTIYNGPRNGWQSGSFGPIMTFNGKLSQGPFTLRIIHAPGGSGANQIGTLNQWALSIDYSNFVPGDVTEDTRVELVDPQFVTTVIKPFGVEIAAPYDVTAVYSGPGTYTLRVTANPGGVATLSAGRMEVLSTTECDPGCLTPPAAPLHVALDPTGGSIVTDESSSATEYVVYSGALGSWYGDPVGCAAPWVALGGGEVQLTQTIADDAWFVVAARNAAGESSAGRDSAGVERKSMGLWSFAGPCP